MGLEHVVWFKRTQALLVFIFHMINDFDFSWALPLSWAEGFKEIEIEKQQAGLALALKNIKTSFASTLAALRESQTHKISILVIYLKHCSLSQSFVLAFYFHPPALTRLS